MLLTNRLKIIILLTGRLSGFKWQYAVKTDAVIFLVLPLI